MTKAQGASAERETIEVRRILGWMDLIISSINDAVCVVNKTNDIVFSNNYFAELIGIERVFLLGKKYSEVFQARKIDSPLPEYVSSKNELASSAEGGQFICEWSNNDNNYIFRISSRILPSNDQTVYLIQNITNEYGLTIMKNDFINLASHQLRTPMTAIMTYSHMLSNEFAGELNSDQRSLVKTLVNSSERMIKLVDSLLYISKVQSGNWHLDKKPLYIGDILDTIYIELEPRILAKQLNYSCIIEKDVPIIYQDKSVLHEIFSNLIVNAIQYTRLRGKITIKVTKKNKLVIIRIKDTGIGIPLSHQPVLFDQFSRADNAAKEFTEGTGIGLYIVKLLLEKTNGTITYKTKNDVGTTFKITLPLR